MKTFLKRLEGNRTIILLGANSLFVEAIHRGLIQQTVLTDYISWILLAFATGTLVKHAQNGFLKPEKGGK